MQQQGQVFQLASGDGSEARWAYRYRVGGRGSRRAFSVVALRQSRRRWRRSNVRSSGSHPSEVSSRRRRLAEFVDVYLRQHGGEPETVDKLRWLLAKSVRVFGDRVSASCARRKLPRGG
jgi:hypothetical protein